MIADTHCLLLPLIEKINSMHPTRELAASFKAILTTPNHCGKSVGPALQWARAFNPVEARLPERNNDLTQLISVPLLLWGLRQPWAETISVCHVVDFWFKYQVRIAKPQEKILEQAWTTHAVRLCSQDPHTNRAQVDALCRA